ncbi:MAG: 23S rRNA (adenine(2503)-C(2))-methyltransferase RlmN [Candidatus Buchananbacteria bacterium]
MDLSALNKILANQPAYRLKQIKQAVYLKLIGDWDEATNLPAALKQKLKDDCPLGINATETASGLSRKALIKLSDGALIETVLLYNADGRYTVCVSSQVGCPLGCLFCATGQGGFERNLTTEEITEQVIYFARQLKLENKKIDNVVFMGMGEPLLNWQNVAAAIGLLNDKDGFGLAARSISVSTCGLIEGLKNIIHYPLQINLAISLHAPNDELRRELMPIASSYKLEELFHQLKLYLKEKGRKLMFEYVMIDGVNDSDQQAKELVELLEKLPKKLVMVNLIPYNPIITRSGAISRRFKASLPEQIKHFKAILNRSGIETTIRKSLGGDIAGACGQLAGKRKR